MNLGFRYHLASLMAIFFSLIFGILIGGAILPDNALVEEQGLLIAQLEERFNESQMNVRSLTTELEFSLGAWQELRDQLVVDRLESKSVILANSGDTRQLESLTDLLTIAGAQVQIMEFTDLTSYNFGTDQFVIVPWTEAEINPDFTELALAGANLTFIFAGENQKVPQDLPPSLCVDHLDFVIGEMALILGLAHGYQGHYGRQEGALGLLPLGLHQ